jgi:RNA polymerase sigma factor (sigma-70 family)
MLLQINGIGNQKISYKDHAEIKFDTLDTYLLLAKKAISKFANKIFNGLSQKMLKDEDAVSSVANAIMMADWRWDENYTNKQGTKKTKYSYRNQCALWAIQTYVSKIYQKPKKIKNVYSLDFNNEDMELSHHECIQDHRTKTPDQELIEKEKSESLSALVDNILSIDYLSDRQKDYIRLYYFEDCTFEKIGQKYGITREAVRQGLNKALDLIRDLKNNE